MIQHKEQPNFPLGGLARGHFRDLAVTCSTSTHFVFRKHQIRAFQRKVEGLSFPTHRQRAPNSSGARSYDLSNLTTKPEFQDILGTVDANHCVFNTNDVQIIKSYKMRV